MSIDRIAPLVHFTNQPVGSRQQPRSTGLWGVLPGSVRGVALATVLALGSVGLALPALAQTPTLDVNLSGQQNAPAVPPVPAGPAIYVDATNGSDTSGDGSQANPFKTITHAIEQAGSGTVIQLFPGNYTAESGEIFPLQLKAGQILRGDESQLGEGFLISGGGMFISPTVARQNVTMLAASGSEVRGVTMRNEGRRGYALWLESSAPKVYNNSFVGNIHDGIFLTGDSDAWIEGNRFYQNGANGISVLGTSSPTIVNNLFQETGFGITVDQKSTPMIRDNRIVQNRSGLVVGGSAQPILRNNLISQNIETGLVAITLAQPNLGTLQEAGNNVFQSNGQFDINNSTRSLQISANGNQISGQVKGAVDTTGQSTQTTNPSAPNVIAEGSLTLPTTATPAPTTQSSPLPLAGQPAPASSPKPLAPAQPSAPTIAVPPAPVVSPKPQAVPPLPVLANTTPKPTQLPPVPVTTATTPAAPVVNATPQPSSATPAAVANSGSQNPIFINPYPGVSPAPSAAASQSSPSPITPEDPAGSSDFKVVPFTPTGDSLTANPDLVGTPAAPTSATPAATPKPLLTDITTLLPPRNRQPQPVAPASNPTSSSSTSVNPPTASPLPAPLAPAAAATPAPVVASNPAPAPASATPQFRVLVTPKSDTDLQKLQQVVPNATATVFNGRNVLQAGLYDNRSTAQSVLDQLLDAGFDAVAEMIFQ